MLWALALTGVAVSAAAVALAYASDGLVDPGIRSALLVWVVLPYVLAGLVAWWRRPESRFGPLMVAVGFTIFLSGLQFSNAPLAYTFGMVFDILPSVLFLHVCLAFPGGRLELPEERWLVGAGYFAAVVLQILKMLLGAGGPDNLIAIVTEPAVANTVEDVQLLSLAAICLAGIPLLLSPRRARTRPLPPWARLLVDSFALGLVSIALLFVAGSFGWESFQTIQRIAYIVIGLSPVAFAIGLLSARLARANLGDLLVELHADPAPEELPGLFARALRDPTLELAYWLPEFETWADLEGNPVELPDADSGRATTLIERDGTRLAALVHAGSLTDERELLDAVSAAAGIALENGRLHADLRARLLELRGSRQRVVEAGQEERKRLERNLHDGAQQRLVALSLDLRMLEKRLGDDPEARALVDQARSEIAMSLDELRDIARGLHPAVLTGYGLGVALESLVARAPLPVTLTVTVDGRLDEPVEVAAYYVVSESLANIGKHAQASTATVTAVRSDDELVVEIVDDGVGGADTEGGSGLRGLADRVEALDGRLRVWTPRGGGTRVRAELPCA
ncbi:MAG TPA: histidine kinase [Thermoleophilaceae bacterium]|nr:histidine kinase [Thermoleophilaceae bacterium]